MQSRHSSFPSLAGALLLVLAVFLLEYLLMALGLDLREPLGLEPGQIALLARLLAHGIVITVALALQGTGYRTLFHDTPSSPLAVIVLTTLPVLLLVPGLLLVEGWLNQALTQLIPESDWEAEAFAQMSDGSLVAVLSVCVFAPVLEEMLFRGVILRGLLQRYPPGVAIVHASAVFGLAHLNIYQFCGAMLSGMVMGWLYERTRSLWPGIVLHAAYNTGVTWLAQQAAGNTGSQDDVYLAAAATTLLAAAWLWRLLRPAP